MSAVVAILYEDELGQAKGFPLHSLVSACVADALGCTTGALTPLLRAVPKKGASKLLAACQHEVARMREPNVFALFDTDRLRDLLNLKGDIQLSDQLVELRSRLPDPVRPRVFPLERNTETLVAAAADCLKRPQPGKNKLDRDKLLGSAAWDHSRASRDCIRDKLPSFAAFVDELIPLVRAALTR